MRMILMYNMFARCHNNESEIKHRTITQSKNGNIKYNNFKKEKYFTEIIMRSQYLRLH